MEPNKKKVSGVSEGIDLVHLVPIYNAYLTHIALKKRLQVFLLCAY